jgi:hypothetical protein
MFYYGDSLEVCRLLVAHGADPYSSMVSQSLSSYHLREQIQLLQSWDVSNWR